VCQKCQPNQQQHVYKPRGIKETARTMGSSKVVYKCSLLFWTARAVSVTSSVFSSGSENSSKRTHRMAFSAAVDATLASSEQGVQRTTVSV